MPNKNEGITFVLKVKDDGTAIISKFSGSFKSLDNALDKATKNQRKWREEADKAAKSSNALWGSVKKLIAIFAGYKAAGWVKDTALLAARYETLGVVMETVGKNIGVNRYQLDELQKGLQKTGISMLQSRQNIIRMIQANIDLSKATDLARVAQNAAVIGNVNSSEAFTRLIYGIQSAQIEVLRTIGINVNFENSYAKVAKQLGKNSKELTETEKANIRMNAVLAAGVNIAGSYESAMNTAGKQLLSWERYLEDARVTLGQAFAPATNEIIMSMVKNTKDLATLFKDPEFQAGIIAIANAIGGLAKAAASASGAFGQFFGGLSTGMKGSELAKQGKLPVSYYEFWKMSLSERRKILEQAKAFEQSSDISAFSESEKWLKDTAALPKPKSLKVTPEVDDKKLKEELNKVDKALKEEFDNWQLDDYEKRLNDIFDKIQEGNWNLPKWALSNDELMGALKPIRDLQTQRNIEVQNGVDDTYGVDWDRLKEQAEDFSNNVISLTQYTAEAMQQNFSDFFFDAITGEFESLADYVDAFGKSIQRSIANYMGQMATQGIFGKDFQGGEGSLINAIGKWLGSAKGNVLSGPGIGMYENQIVSSPKVFGFAKGIGIIGEGSKPEGVLPLARTSTGDLGVQSVGGLGMPKIEINIYNQGGEEVKKSSVQTRFDYQGLILDVVLDGANRNVNGFADLMGLKK